MKVPTVKAADITNMAINTAIDILKRCGCDYTLRSPDGQTYTNGKPKVRRPKKYSFKHLQITEKFNNAIPGQVIVFPAGHIPLKNLGSRITGEACRVFGAGNYATTTDAINKTVSIRVGVLAQPLAKEVERCIRNFQQSKGSTELLMHS